MTATPDDIARYTRDGLALTYQNDDLKTAQPRATDDGEIPTFFRYAADGQRFLTERVNLRGAIAPFHEAVEVEETLGIGTSIAVTPNVPCARVIDETRNISVIARVRSASLDATIDRYSVELVG